MHRRLDETSVLRDAVRRRVRRASMRAKIRWDVLEAELYDLDNAAEGVVTEANHQALTAGLHKVEAFRAWLEGER